jgi:hypothetical protein
MLDGAGDAVFGLLRTLKESSWSDDEIDARLEVTLVERKRKTNGFHEHAIPCVTARRGDIHGAIKGCDAAELPHVVYFNYAATTAACAGGFPGGGYATRDRFEATARSCEKLLAAGASRAVPTIAIVRFRRSPVPCKLFLDAVRRSDGLLATELSTVKLSTASPAWMLYAVEHAAACRQPLEFAADSPRTAGDGRTDRARFVELVFQLQQQGMADSCISQLLGYSGGNGERELGMVMNGRSRNITASQACAVLENAMKHRGWSTAPDKSELDWTVVHNIERDILNGRIICGSAIHVNDSVSWATPGDLKNAVAAIGQQRSKQSEFHDGEGGFYATVKHVAGSFAPTDVVPAHAPFQISETGPAVAPRRLSEWCAGTTKAGVFPPDDGSTLRQDQHFRAELLANEVHRKFTTLADEGRPVVKVWMMDGAGHIVYRLLRSLLEQQHWSEAELDARLELTLVDWNRAMNDYHAWAIPCATVLRGNVHWIVANSKPPELPHVMYFNYSTTTTSGTVMAKYEAGAWPGGTYSTDECMKDTMSSCNTILENFGSAALIVGFSLAPGERDTREKIHTAAEHNKLFIRQVHTERLAFCTFAVTAPPTDAVAPAGAAPLPHVPLPAAFPPPLSRS